MSKSNCAIATPEDIAAANEANTLVQEHIMEDINHYLEKTSGGGPYDYLICKVKGHVLCGIFITLITGVTLMACFDFYKANQGSVQNLMEYFSSSSMPDDTNEELLKILKDIEKAKGCADEETMKNAQELKFVQQQLGKLIGESLFNNIKENASQYYNELYSKVEGKFNFCSSIGGRKKRRKTMRKKVKKVKSHKGKK